MATVASGLCGYVAPCLSEEQVYPSRIPVPIRNTFIDAAIALGNYENLRKTRGDETAGEMLACIDNAAQLILDASGRLFKNEKMFSEFTQEEVELDYRFEFIMIYKPIFPEVDVEQIRKIPLIAPIFSQKTRELARRFTNPERLTDEERTGLAHILIAISDSIGREQYRANR
jgi:hypothetical protein